MSNDSLVFGFMTDQVLFECLLYQDSQMPFIVSEWPYRFETVEEQKDSFSSFYFNGTLPQGFIPKIDILSEEISEELVLYRPKNKMSLKFSIGMMSSGFSVTIFSSDSQEVKIKNLATNICPELDIFSSLLEKEISNISSYLKKIGTYSIWPNIPSHDGNYCCIRYSDSVRLNKAKKIFIDYPFQYCYDYDHEQKYFRKHLDSKGGLVSLRESNFVDEVNRFKKIN